MKKKNQDTKEPMETTEDRIRSAMIKEFEQGVTADEITNALCVSCAIILCEKGDEWSTGEAMLRIAYNRIKAIYDHHGMFGRNQFCPENPIEEYSFDFN